MLRFSIITVCYNSGKYIRSAIDSVLHQEYGNIEYIIIDGASSDNTVDIIKIFGNKISSFISESDSGIYDAMNKGLKMAQGDIIGLLNSDDFYSNEKVLESVAEYFRLKNTDCVYGDLIYVNPENTGKTVRYWKSREFIPGSFRYGWHPPHPALFIRNDIYRKHGYFNLNFKLAADFELMLRFFEKGKISASYMPEPIVKMRLGGATNKSIKNILLQNIECYRAFKSNGLGVSLFYPVYRLIPKMSQYFLKWKN
ncbi:MAG: glycosyltransferase [Bacteroidetes bacterium]|nr:glycosyltransferase [Bacteroidota bacterium]